MHYCYFLKVLLAAANLLQLDYVKNVCAQFLQTQLDASNCLGIKAFADSYDCMELSTSSRTYIKNRFLYVYLITFFSYFNKLYKLK